MTKHDCLIAPGHFHLPCQLVIFSTQISRSSVSSPAAVVVVGVVVPGVVAVVEVWHPSVSSQARLWPGSRGQSSSPSHRCTWQIRTLDTTCHVSRVTCHVLHSPGAGAHDLGVRPAPARLWQRVAHLHPALRQSEVSARSRDQVRPMRELAADLHHAPPPRREVRLEGGARPRPRGAAAGPHPLPGLQRRHEI